MAATWTSVFREMFHAGMINDATIIFIVDSLLSVCMLLGHMKRVFSGISGQHIAALCQDRLTHEASILQRY